MTVGIYQIINLLNGKSYIGQSNQIEKRWINHKIASTNKKDKGYEYPLYRAFRKYGIDNFEFIILEKCSVEKLDERECYWIEQKKPEYNQTAGGEHSGNSKLNLQQVQEIQKELQFNKNVNHKLLASLYNVSVDTIRDINLGKTWNNNDLKYPLHISKYDHYRNTEKKNYCSVCGIEISKNCTTCIKHIDQSKQRKVLRPSREELKKLIRDKSFLSIAREDFGNQITDNAIRKWCDNYNLPRTKKEINSYSDSEWNLI